MKVFKIRHKDTGLFSTGGLSPKWVKQGKIWQQLRHVHSHMHQMTKNYSPADTYSRAEVVEAEITEILRPIEDATDYLNKLYDERIEMNTKRLTTASVWEFDYASRGLEDARQRKALMNESK